MTEPLVVEIHATTEGTATFPYLQVVVGENAEASVLVDYRLADGARLLLVPRVDLEVADSGRLRSSRSRASITPRITVVHQRAVWLEIPHLASVRWGWPGWAGSISG